MNRYIPTRLLILLANATPEKWAQVERFLMLSPDAPADPVNGEMGKIQSMFCQLRREIAAIRGDYNELRRTKEDLEKMRAQDCSSS